MVNIKMSMSKSTGMKLIKRLFRNATDQRVIDAISIRNMRNIFMFSLIICVFDAISLMLYSITHWDASDFWQTFIHVSCCIAGCGIVAFLSRRFIRKYEKEGTISSSQAHLLVMFFYVVVSGWSIIVDISHYMAGDQMLTFYIAQFCFVCFVVMRPKIGGILIAASFATMYICTYFVDGAAEMQPQNVIVFALIAVVGNAIQHMIFQESEESKADILELNQILQQEASIDDLTKMKNRKALRNDFGTFIGKSVYTIMADIDDFKSCNDTYGHVVGDDVLRQVAAAIMETFGNESTYRYGGDEFFVVLEGCTESEFEEKIGRWTEAIRAIRISDAVISVTCSYGYEQCLIISADELRNAIRKADERLYEAKEARSTRTSWPAEAEE